MNISSSHLIELDPKMLVQFCSTEIETKSDLLGFYKKDDKTYVITTKNHCAHPSLNTKIEDIVDLLANPQFAEDRPFEGLKQSYQFLQYLDHIYRIVERHNVKIIEIKKNPLLALLLQIPLIASIVNKIFKELSPPVMAEAILLNKQKDLYKQSLKEAHDPQTLRTTKQRLVQEAKEATLVTTAGKGIGLHNSFQKTLIDFIEEDFEREIFERSPSLILARNIVDDITAPLNFDLEMEPVDAAKQCNARTQSLNLSTDFNDLASEKQKKMITEAKRKIITAYRTWWGQRIHHIAKKAREKGVPILITDLLGVQKPEEIKQKCESRIKELTAINDDEAILILGASYEEYLTPAFTAFKTALEEPRMLFTTTKDTKELETTFAEKLQYLTEWYQFKKTRPVKESEEEFNRLKEKLQIAHNHRLAAFSKIFAEAQCVLGDNQQANSSLPTFMISDSSSRLQNLSDRMLSSSIELFKYEMTKIGDEDLTEESINYIQNAHYKLLEELKRRKEQKLAEQLKEREQAHSFLSFLPSFLTNVFNDKNQPLKQYRETLFKVLGVSKKKQIEIAYKKKLEEFAEIPDSIHMKQKVEILYQSYHRALILQPLIKKVSSRLITSGKISLIDLFTQKQLTEMVEEEKYVDQLLALVEKEINFQSVKDNNPLSKLLKKVEKQLKLQWEQFIELSRPKYVELKRIVELGQGRSTNLYFKAFRCPLSEIYTSVQSKYEKMLKDFTLAEDSHEVLVFKEAAIKAKQIVIYAYKEWEAERILAAYKEWDDGNLAMKYWKEPEKELTARMLGISVDSSLEAKKTRYKFLQMLLHPDKNKCTPQELREIILASGKLLLPPE